MLVAVPGLLGQPEELLRRDQPAPFCVIGPARLCGAPLPPVTIAPHTTSAIITPGTRTSLKVLFKKKGIIQVVCDVPRHIQLGMVSSFKVK